MSKRLEFSEKFNSQDWETLALWSDEEVEENWSKLQAWIEDTQVYGFFRLVDVE